jgi:hypothetical protein
VQVDSTGQEAPSGLGDYQSSGTIGAGGFHRSRGPIGLGDYQSSGTIGAGGFHRSKGPIGARRLPVIRHHRCRWIPLVKRPHMGWEITSHQAPSVQVDSTGQEAPFGLGDYQSSGTIGAGGFHRSRGPIGARRLPVIRHHRCRWIPPVERPHRARRLLVIRHHRCRWIPPAKRPHRG